ncbi:MAG TPA: hypothetical protein VFT12_14650, partial [Thermoanaerobaculia bacterium]|nr:hypothetical protein [Thermoanaerobaculia bacterium]
MQRIAGVLLSVLVSFTAVADPKAIQESRRLQTEARKAYADKNYALFLEKIRASSDLRPDHPTLLYFLAGALTLNGRTDEALTVLERVAAMGMVYSPGKEPDFAALAQSPRFDRIACAFACNGSVIGTERTAAWIDEHGIIPEGLARDTKRKVFYLSSVRRGDVWRISNKETKKLVAGYPLAILGL